MTSSSREAPADISQPGRRQYVALALLAVVAIGLWLALGRDGDSLTPTKASGTVEIVQDGRKLQSESVAALEALSAPDLERWLDEVPARRRERTSSRRVTFATDEQALEGAVRAAVEAGGGTVDVPERATESNVRLPIVQQALRNNCETAALSMLLEFEDVSVEQLDLQRQLPTSGPPDPETSSTGAPSVWGDPSEGFVGRADGGGTSGGYGVYEKPIAALAGERGVKLADLTRDSPKDIYGRLLEGRPVMVWVGLTADGPYETWRTPEGRKVTGNFGEHTVVLTGLRGDDLYVNDPLVGERTTWTRTYFEQLWERLDRRALSV